MLFMCIPRELRCLGSSFEGKRRDLCCFPHPSGIPAASHCRLMEGKEGFPLGVRQCSLSLCCCCCVFPTTPPSACPLLPICRVCYLCACPWPCTVRISFTKICFMFSCSPFHVFGVIFLYANINIDRCWGGGGYSLFLACQEPVASFHTHGARVLLAYKAAVLLSAQSLTTTAS